MKLVLQSVSIATIHISYVFILYGTRSLRMLRAPDLLITFVWLGVPTFAAFTLYYFSFSRAGILSEPMRRTKLTASSICSTVISLYCGMFLALNTFGS